MAGQICGAIYRPPIVVVIIIIYIIIIIIYFGVRCAGSWCTLKVGETLHFP